MAKTQKRKTPPRRNTSERTAAAEWERRDVQRRVRAEKAMAAGAKQLQRARDRSNRALRELALWILEQDGDTPPQRATDARRNAAEVSTT
jgi:capsule polysaccharide export protein KpsE/RkpR